MDDLRMLGTLLDRPGPSADVTARGRDRLRAAAHGPVRRRRFTWPAVALGTVATATAAIVVVSDLSPTATPNGPPPPVAASGRQILLAAATIAAARPAGSGAYWHVKTVYRNPRLSKFIESWTRKDGRQYVRNGSKRPVRVGGERTAFSIFSMDLTFEQIQSLPTDPAALKAKITEDERGMAGHVVGPGRDPLMVQSLTELLARVPAPPKVRATAFRALAGLPGVSRAGSTPDGQTLLIRNDREDMTMVVDPATSLVRGWTITAPPPSRDTPAWMGKQSVSVPTAEWTARPPVE
ncbi:CU044_5270 family protein [Actinomadura sp. DC4]|uniref:CU044_5270 family protein n=1 Tax=Actinomadura sp. DC4 TaxID=3055069 RepID=UPI0025B115EC|nr:CU044_5270 family protein [Actinomadura sp. DC4]MDN3358895.1 CU044_5270 family protein [Actinomadura sp. DC4]